MWPEFLRLLLSIFNGQAHVGGARVTGDGTSQRITSSETSAGWLLITVDPNASGPVYYGGATVLAATPVGTPLWPGQARQIYVADPSAWYVSAATGDKWGWELTR